jgi:hypothetical protein
MTLRRRALAGLMLAPLVMAAGCASSPGNVDPADPNLSIVCGYIDMSKAPSDLRWVSIKAYGKGMDHHYRTRVHDGVFFHVGVDPGSYQIDRFGGQGGIPMLTSRPFEYEWGTRGRNPTAVRIEKPGVYFVGAYGYRPEASGLLEADRFDMQATKTPSESEVLRRVLASIEGDAELRRYALQIQRIRARLGGGA